MFRMIHKLCSEKNIVTTTNKFTRRSEICQAIIRTRVRKRKNIAFSSNLFP